MGGTAVGDGIIQDQTDAEPTLSDLVNVIQGPNARSARSGYVEVETVQPDSLQDDPTDGDTDPEEAEDQFPISSILDYVSPFQPRRSGLRDLQEAARRQSFAFTGTRSRATPEEFQGLPKTPYGPVAPPASMMNTHPTTNVQRSPRTGGNAARFVTLNGVRVRVRVHPNTQIVRARMWDKTKRATLDHETLQLFIKSATGYALDKKNKLSVQSLKPDEDGKLEEVHNLQSQLRLIRNHLYSHDMLDVFNIVLPKHVSQEPTLVDPTSYDLFQHYAKFTADMVANSCAWYNYWLSEPYVRENMTYSLAFLQNNTSDSLWAKCLETYDDFDPAQQGGPLMLFLVLKKIQDTSESAIESLKTRIANLKIRDLKGEDVDLAVSMIRSTVTALEGASGPDHSYVPDDFPQTVLKILQTTSVRKFNDAFDKEETEARHAADKLGCRPKWPTIHQTLNLASNTYGRMLAEGSWCVPVGSKKSTFNATTSTPGNYRCWNCGLNHKLPDCPEPRDEAKIEKARQEYKARRQHGKKDKVKRDDQNRPLKKNKKNVYVVDTKKWNEERGIVPTKKKDSEKPKPDTPSASPSKADLEKVKTEFHALVSELQTAPPSSDNKKVAFKEQTDRALSALDRLFS